MLFALRAATVLLAMSLIVSYEDTADAENAWDTLFIPHTQGVEANKLRHLCGYLPAVGAMLERIGGMKSLKD